MKRIKRFLSGALILTSMIGISVPASAVSNTSYYDGAKVSVGRETSSSWHQVSGVSYPSASGTITYVYNGKINSKPISGTTYSSYWYGSLSINGTTSSATTKYKGYELSV